MNCPYCTPEQQRGSRVIETRPGDDDRVLRRRRHCLGDAQHRFTTYERIVDRDAPDVAPSADMTRHRLPRERQSVTHQFIIGGHEGYITAGMYEDGTVGEIFLTDLGGSALRGMMNAFATSISIALQYGVPLEALVKSFSSMRFEPDGITQNPEIPVAKSLPDYVMRWLASRFLDPDVQNELGILTPEVRARNVAEEAAMSTDSSEADRARAGSTKRVERERGSGKRGKRR